MSMILFFMMFASWMISCMSVVLICFFVLKSVCAIETMLSSGAVKVSMSKSEVERKEGSE